jgi:hypothetical protein
MADIVTMQHGLMNNGTNTRNIFRRINTQLLEALWGGENRLAPLK